MLRGLKKYIKECKKVSLRDIALHFDTDPGAIEQMLNVWIGKGIIRRVQKEKQNTCHGCARAYCDEASMILYEWLHK